MDILNNSSKIPKTVVLQSLLLGFFMDIKCINQILGTYGYEEDSSIMTLLYIGTIAAILGLGVISGSLQKPGKLPTIILIYIGLSYFITTSFGGQPWVTLPHLIVFTIFGFLIPFIAQIDARITLRAVMLYPLFGINHIGEIFVFVTDWNEWISMGKSYAFYVPIVATIVYLNVYFKSENKLNKIITLALAAINFVYLFMIFQFGSRGPIMLLLLLIMFLFTVRHSDDNSIKVNKHRLLLFGFIGIIFLLSFNQVLLLVDSFLNDIGVSSHTIDKFIYLAEEGDISHGRNEIQTAAINGFFESPLWGNGLDCFDQNTGLVYPHNFFLQILYDGGLLLLFILVVPVINNTKNIFHFCTDSFYCMFIFLLFAGIAGGLFSGDLWRQPLLWMFVGLTFSKYFIYENQ